MRFLKTKTLKERFYPPVQTKFLIAFVLETTIIKIGNASDIVFTSFFLYLNFEDSQIVILLSLVGFCQLLQILSTPIYKHIKNKKRVILSFRLIRSLLLVLVGFVPLIFKSDNYYPVIFILVLLRLSFINLIGGAFLEWNDSYIPEKMKGRYYGKRNALLNAGSIISTFIIGLLLDHFEGSSTVYLAIFLGGLLVYLFEWIMLKDISFIQTLPKESLSFTQSITLPIKDRRYFHFMIFSILWMFAMNIGRPLLNIYSVKYMHYSYSLIALIGSITAFVKIFSGVIFGKFIDDKGVHFVIKVSGIGFAIFNFFFIFMIPNNPIIYIIAVVFNGIFMIGFNVAKLRLNMRLSTGEHMNTYLSINTFFMGLATFLSLYLSSFIIKFFKTVHITLGGIEINSYQLLFLTSSLLHLIAVYYFIITIAERNDQDERIQSASFS